MLSQQDLRRRAAGAIVWRGVELGGTRVVSLVRFLVLARLLGPEDFGLLAIAAAALELLVTVTDLGVGKALVQRATVRDRDLDLGWTIGILRALTMAVVLVLAAPQLADVLGDGRAAGLLRVLALQPVLASLESIAMTRRLRTLQFSAFAGLNLGAALVEAVTAIALAPVLGVWALVTATLLSAATKSVLSYVAAPHRPRLVLERAAAASLMRFGTWVLVGVAFDAIGDTALRAAIGHRLGATELGLFFVATRLGLMPNAVVSELVTPVAFSVHAQLGAAGRTASNAFGAVVAGMVALLAPVTGVLVALAQPLADDVLGPRWVGAAPVLALMAVTGFITIAVDASEPLLHGRGRPAAVALIRAVRALGVVVLAWSLAGSFGLTGAAVAAVSSEAVVAAVALWLTRAAWAASRSLLLRLVGAALVAGAGSALVAVQLADVIPGITGVSAAAVAGCGAGWLLFLQLDRALDLRLRALARAVSASLAGR